MKGCFVIQLKRKTPIFHGVGGAKIEYKTIYGKEIDGLGCTIVNGMICYRNVFDFLKYFTDKGFVNNDQLLLGWK